MAHSAQAKKRIRQNEKRRLYNKSRRSEIKTLTKRFAAFCEEKKVDEAKALFPAIVSKLDKAVKRNVYHKNTAARRKSQIASMLNSASSTA